MGSLCTIESIGGIPSHVKIPNILGIFTFRVNILPTLLPLVTNLHLSLKCSTKQPCLLYRTCNPCSTIWQIETKFFVIVGTCNTSAIYFSFPSCIDKGTFPTCSIGCIVSSLCFYITWFIWLFHFIEPILMICHVV